jgi:signal transduction histidine kinase
MKFKNLKLGTKQFVGFACILAIMVGVNIYSQQTIKDLKNELDEVTSNWLQRMSRLSEINLSTTNLRLYQLQHVFADNDSTKKQQADYMVVLIDQINANLDVYDKLKTYSEQKNLYSDEEGQHYRAFAQHWETYQDLFFEIFRHSRSGQNEEAIALLNGRALDEFLLCGAELSALVALNEEGSLDASIRADQSQRATHKISTTLLVVTVLLSVVIAFVLVRYITVPVQRLAQAARNVAQGDLATHLDADSEDEIGQLTLSFNRMTEALQKARTQTESQQNTLELTNRDLAQSNGDLQDALAHLQETQEQLVMQEKMAALGDLVAGVAHEINNPIGVVTSATDVSNRCVLRIEQELGHVKKGQIAQIFDMLKDNLRITKEAGDRVAMIVKSLRTFSRLDEAEYQKVDIHEGLESSLTLIESDWRGRVSIEKNYTSQGEMTCYASQLNQVFLTLLKNATAAIESTGTISITTRRDKGHIEISDSGHGMGSAQLNTIFEFGFSVGGKRVKMRSGLSAAYNVVQRHHGTIRVESQEGKGSTFRIDLPLS